MKIAVFVSILCCNIITVLGASIRGRQGNTNQARDLQEFPERRTKPPVSKDHLKLSRVVSLNNITPSPTQAPSCSPVDLAGYFEKSEFVTEAGAKDATYTIKCDEKLDVVVLKSDPVSCQVECIGALWSSIHNGVCKDKSELTFILEGDYLGETILMGSRNQDAYLFCDAMTLVTEAPTTPRPTPSPTPSPTARPPTDTLTDIGNDGLPVELFPLKECEGTYNFKIFIRHKISKDIC